MSTAPTETGMNRTGIALSPIDGKAMTEAAERATTITGPGGPAEAEALRRELSESAPPRGTVPPPATIKGLAKTAIGMLKGEHLAVLIDLVGERLACERCGVRLYQALRVKFEAAEPHEGGPEGEELERFETEKFRHLGLLVHALESLGADPTTITPSADVMGVVTQGVVQLLGDPRTTLTEALRGILIAELADNDGWRILSQLAAELKQTDLARDFDAALAEEEAHLGAVRKWLSTSIFVQAGAEPPVLHSTH